MNQRPRRRSHLLKFLPAALAAAVLVPSAASKLSQAAPPSVDAAGINATETTAAESTAAESTSATAAAREEVNYRKITAAQWKQRLSAQQFLITRKHGTERAYSSKLHDSKADGVYQCVCCGENLFDSQHKFDSGTGWPSFFRPLEEDAVGASADRKLGYVRTEIHCSRCDAHLGHVFRDAPQTPTGLRYCMNGVALNFVERQEWQKQRAASSERRAASGE